MPKWDRFIDEEELTDLPSFEKFSKSLKIGRRLLKKEDEELTQKQKEQLKRERDEKRAFKRGDEV